MYCENLLVYHLSRTTQIIKYGIAGGQSVLVHVDGAGSASVDKNGVLGGRVARRSLLSGTLGGRALMTGFYSSFGSVVDGEMRRCGGVDGYEA